MQIDGRESDLDLLCWLIDLGKTDRAHYRKIRAAMWAMFVENSESMPVRSDIPSKYS